MLIVLSHGPIALALLNSAEVVTGVSLPMLILAASLRESGMHGDKLLETVLEETKTGMTNVKQKLEMIIK